MRAVVPAGVGLLLLAALTPVAPALHTSCVPGTSIPTLTLGSGSRYSFTIYVAVDDPMGQEVFVPLPWIYAESNGRDGLQRQDDWRDDSCSGEYAPDMLIF